MTPRTRSEVEAHYRQLQNQHQQQHASLAAANSNLFRVLGGVAIAIVYLTARSLHGAAPAWPFLVAFACVLAIVIATIGRQTRLARQQRLLSFYDNAIDRVAGTAPQSNRTGTDPGQDLRSANHLYQADLNLLGADSLFSLLATVRTGPGERGLARYLLDSAPHAETLERQAAVQELLPQTELREQIALLGATRFHQISASFFDEWLAEPAPAFHPGFRFALFVTAGFNLVLLLVGLLHLRTWGNVLPLLAVVLALQGAICFYLRERVRPLLEGGARLELNVRLLADGLDLMQRATFACPKLQRLQRSAQEPAGAVKLLKDLTSSLAIVEQRTKEYFLIFSLLLAAGTQAAISIAAWKRGNAAAMQHWLNAWAEFEALNALATYAFEHPEDVWPELLPPDHPPLFASRRLAHPLLPDGIPNDINLSAPATIRDEQDPTATPAQFLLISGSNMSGKSTLLRAIGINAVLAYAGAPVRAQSLRLTPLILGASLAITDSLADGKSKFLAEVERLSAVVTASQGSPVLFLVDEIFSGTNSADRRTAAAAVLARLLANGAIGALSTHDLALTELATDENAGQNVHMASPNPEDPLAFDYKLKPGPNTTTNALAIIRMLGL